MESQNTIKTIFEYTSTGYKESVDTLNEALAISRELKKEQQELSKEQAENSKTIVKLTEKWQAYTKSLDTTSTKEAREDFVKTKKAIEDVTVAQAKIISQKDANAKAIERENTKLKEAEAITNNYRKVMDELSKGMDNAKVSTEAMSKAKKYLNDQLGKTDVGTEQYKILSKELAVVTKGLGDVTEAQKRQVKQEGVAGDSIEALRQKVSLLNKEWKSMSTSDPDFGSKAQELKETTDALKEAEEAVGIFSRSVGNYEKGAQSLVSMGNPILAQMLGIVSAAPTAKGAMDAMSAGAKGFGMALKALLANPVVLVIAGIVAVFMALKKALNSSEEATARFNAILAPLRMLMDGVLNVLQMVVGVVLSGVEAFMELGMSLSRLMEDLPFVGKYFKEANDTIADSIKLEQAKYDLDKKVRQNMIDEAKNVRDINKLKAQFAEKDKYTSEERLKFMQQAVELESKNADQSLAISKEKLRIAEEEASRAQNNKEIEEQLAQLRADVFRAESDYFSKRKEMNAQMAEAQNAIKAEEKKRADDAKSAQDKAIQTQQKINSDYIKSAQDKFKAEQDLKKAEQDGDAKGIELYSSILAEKNRTFEEASKKRLTLTQLEKDELELAEYQHQKALNQIKQDAEDKEKERIKKIGDEYLKAKSEEVSAQARLLEAQKGGNQQEIDLYTRLLQQKTEARKKFDEEQVVLNEEQQLEKDTAEFEAQQKAINDYIALQQQYAQLNAQFQATGSIAEREVIQKQINLVNTKIKAQIKGLEVLGVAADTITINIANSTNEIQSQLADRLEQSIDIINEYAGKSKNIWYKTASSIAALIAKAFDFKSIPADIDKTSEAFIKLREEQKSAVMELGVAVALNGVNAVTDMINSDLEAQKKAIDEAYSYQERRSKESYDEQSNDLKEKLSKNEISEAKYKLEQMKLDDKKALEDKKRDKQKAEQQYTLEVKQFRVNQANSAIGIIMATALAIMQGFAQLGPIGGSVYAGVVGALGAVQTALVYSQKPPQKPKFEKGGGVRFEKIEGDSHANGGVPIRFGDKVVAEAEGDEGALIISRKAMRNRYMRNLLRKVENANADISGSSGEGGMFEDGGSMDFKSYDEDFFIPARNSLSITKRKKRSVRINGDKVSLKPYGWNADAAIDDAAEKIAQPQWNAYVARTQSELDSREKNITDTFSNGIANNGTFKSMGISSVDQYNKAQSKNQEELDILEKQIIAYEDTAKSRIEALKTEMQYEEQLAKFDTERSEATKQLETDTKAFNIKVLDGLRDTAQITEEEYDSMLDQITNGYGVSTSDIINLKKKEVEAVKKLINEERNAAIKAAQDTASYREKALDQIRSDWQNEYNEITKQIIEDVEGATDAVAKLSGTDLERYNQILAIQQRIKALNEDYKKNETILTDGVIESREERAKLLEEQKRIQEELKLKEEESEKAKAAFEEERSKNMESAQAQWEKDNFDSLLAQIKELGSSLQADANKWSLDKALAEELDSELKNINSTYDEQIAKQDAIVAGLEKELDAMQLAHDKKIANIKKEETAFKESFESQKKEIESWLSEATAQMKKDAVSLASALAALKLAGYEAGLKEYEAAMDLLNKDIDNFSSSGGTPKYEDGGAINLGSGLYQVSGASHAQGGVAVRVGNTKVAEVEGIEKMLAINKYAANDPDMIMALNKASEVNNRYTGVSLVDKTAGGGFALDYNKLAQSIGAQINSRPVETYVTHTAISKAISITSRHRRASFMN